MKLPTQAVYGDSLVIREVGLAHSAVRWWTNSIVDHAACCIGDGGIIDARACGVTQHPVDIWVDIPWILLRPKQPLTSQQIEVGQEWLPRQIGKKYNWGGILSYPLDNIHLNDPNRWDCSQLVRAWYFKMGLEIVLRTPLSFTSPQTVFSSSELMIVDYNLPPELLVYIQTPVFPKLQPV